jgi:phosphatidylinositol 3-kinase
VLPITYPSLQPTSQLAFTVWDVQGAGKAVPVGGTTMKLFRPDR